MRTGEARAHKGNVRVGALIRCAHSRLLYVHLGAFFKCLGCRCFRSFTVEKGDTSSDRGSWQYRSLVKVHIFFDASGKRTKKVADKTSASALAFYHKGRCLT